MPASPTITTIVPPAPIPQLNAIPLITPATVGDGSAAPAISLNFAGVYNSGPPVLNGPGSVSQISIYNTGSNPVFMMFNVPAAANFPSAAVAAASVSGGVYIPGTFMLPAGAVLVLTNTLINNIGLICGSGLTTTIETVAMQASETNSGVLG